MKCGILDGLPIIERDVLHKIKKIEASITGPHKISPRILKEIKYRISEPLSVLFINKFEQLGRIRLIFNVLM